MDMVENNDNEWLQVPVVHGHGRGSFVHYFNPTVNQAKRHLIKMGTKIYSIFSNGQGYYNAEWFYNKDKTLRVDKWVW